MGINRLRLPQDIAVALNSGHESIPAHHEKAFTQQERPECRVLQVFSSLGVGGAETWLIALLKYLNSGQDDLPVRLKFDICLTGEGKEHFDDQAEALGARLFYIPFSRKNVLPFIRDFRRILIRGGYQAIHDHQDYIAGLHFMFGAGHLPPVRIAHVHNPLYHRKAYSHDYLRRLTVSSGKRLLRRYATHILGTSRQIISEYGFDELASNSVTLGAAHCGFDVTRYLGDYRQLHADLCQEFGWDESVRIILFVGRLGSPEVEYQGLKMSHKNPVFALDVAKACIAKDARVRFLMAGSGGAKRRELEASISSSGLSEKIRLLGVRSDIPRLMGGSDLFLFPSLAEGLGMVVVEAQAAGLSVLASDTTPKECVVLPDMLVFKSLASSPVDWADAALGLINRKRLDSFICNNAVRESPFFIGNSAANLQKVYSPMPEPQKLPRPTRFKAAPRL